MKKKIVLASPIQRSTCSHAKFLPLPEIISQPKKAVEISRNGKNNMTKMKNMNLKRIHEKTKGGATYVAPPLSYHQLLHNLLGKIKQNPNDPS